MADASGDNEVTVGRGRGGLWEDKKEEVTCRNCLFHEGVMSCPVTVMAALGGPGTGITILRDE